MKERRKRTGDFTDLVYKAHRFLCLECTRLSSLKDDIGKRLSEKDNQCSLLSVQVNELMQREAAAVNRLAEVEPLKQVLLLLLLPYFSYHSSFFFLPETRR